MGKNMPKEGETMSRKQNYSRFSMRKQKSYLTVGVIALAAVIAMAGIYYKKNSEQKAEQQEAVIMAESEWTDTDDDTRESGGEDTDTADKDAESGAGTEEEGSGEAAGAEENEPEEELQNTVSIVGSTQGAAEAAASEPAALTFSEADQLDWPLNGDVILNYSMDQSVYFATLDQYKYNPALVIAGEVNSKVMAAADGQVISVETTPETGETMTVDIGGGFQLIYGQLKELQFSPGDRISKGELIGFVSEPTKYYSVEGSNLYFEMLRDGEPVNPMNYLTS